MASEKFSFEPAFYAVQRGFFSTALENYTKHLDEIRSTIKRKGLKKSYIAEQMGITPTTFWKKLSGQAKFTRAELYMLSDILNGRYEQQLQEIER